MFIVGIQIFWEGWDLRLILEELALLYEIMKNDFNLIKYFILNLD